MFLAIWSNEESEIFKNEAELVRALRGTAICNWPLSVFKQIDRNNLRRMKIAFDATQDTFDFKVTKVSK